MRLYAPVSITVYDRLHHLRECITALLQNPEAPNTVLYIFSDAPKAGDESRIELVRSYVRTISGFGEVRIIFQETNSHAHNNKQACANPLRDFGRIIRMEDDIVVSHNFLGYMNEALDRFENDERIFSISGYTPDFGNLKPDDVFLSKDFSGWGYATWKDRNLPECIERRDYYHRIRLDSEACYLAKILHPLLLPMLQLIAQGKMNPGDYKLTAHQFLSRSFSLRPGVSLVRNIGFDGSGMGGGGKKTNRFDTQFFDQKPTIPDHIAYDLKLDKALFNCYFPKGAPSIFAIRLKLILIGLISLEIYKNFRYARTILRNKLNRSR